jgi:predicted nucleic acid-binding protein
VSLVLDCSATLAWLYPDETTDPVRQVFDLIADQGCSVPSLWRLEVANGITVAVRRGRITAAFKADALNALALLPISVDSETGDYAWTATLQLADRFGLTVYDAAYLELAQRRSLPLASLDLDLRRAAQVLRLQLMAA